MNKVNRIFMSLLGNRKKATYELFDYLEHTGHGEYINLPYRPNNKTRLVFKYSVPTTTQELTLFGSRDSGRTSVLYWIQNTNSGSIISRTGGGPTNFGNTILYDWYEVEALTSSQWVRRRPGTSTVDQTRNWDATEFVVPFNLYLFAINHNDGPIGPGAHDSKVNLIPGLKISAIELYEDTELLMDLKPARRDDGRTGYLDVFNNVFYDSENEYNFNVGNYADEYDYYDYLENTVGSGYSGQQYIRTGINGGSNVKIKIKGQLTQTNRFFMFGSRDAVNQNQFLCRLVALRSGTTQTTFNYGSIPTVYSFGVADIDSVYTIETFPDHWTRSDQNGNVVTVNIPETTFQSHSIITLFALNENNKYAYSLMDYGRIGDCQIWVDGVLQRDYKPAVRRWDGKVGMYEKVNNILYQSCTSTAFATYGNWS